MELSGLPFVAFLGMKITISLGYFGAIQKEEMKLAMPVYLWIMIRGILFA